MGWDEMGWDEMGMGWDGMGWDEMRRDEMRRDEMVGWWDGVVRMGPDGMGRVNLLHGACHWEEEVATREHKAGLRVPNDL